VKGDDAENSAKRVTLLEEDGMFNRFLTFSVCEGLEIAGLEF
jgi:hypothetical protein